jgi:cytochrome c5
LPPDAPLRTAVRASTRRAISRRATVATFLAMALVGGCRSAGVDRTAVSDPTLKAVTGPAEAAEIAALPDGPGKALVSDRCLLCHGAGLIVQQRKDAAAWGRTVTQMRTWGTPIQDEDQTAIVAYLAQHYGPGSARR